MEGAVPTLAYGISKAGANYLVRKVHFECEREGLVSLAIHPGYVVFLSSLWKRWVLEPGNYKRNTE